MSGRSCSPVFCLGAWIMAARFVTPVIQDNPTGWGPNTIPPQFKGKFVVIKYYVVPRHFQLYLDYDTKRIAWTVFSISITGGIFLAVYRYSNIVNGFFLHLITLLKSPQTCRISRSASPTGWERCPTGLAAPTRTGGMPTSTCPSLLEVSWHYCALFQL